jgi:hypothetical protein
MLDLKQGNNMNIITWCYLALMTVLLSGCPMSRPATIDVPAEKEVINTFELSILPIKLDMLWVIDQSSAMCSARNALAQAMNLFQTDFVQKNGIDIHVAATPTYALTHHGLFSSIPAKDCPPAGFETRRHPCGGDGDCEEEFGELWTCKPPTNASALYNLNLSVNSTCTYRCMADFDCCKEFCFEDICGADMNCMESECAETPNANCTYECKVAGGGEPSMGNSGCLARMVSEDCPEKVDQILTNDTLSFLKCIVLQQPMQSYMANFGEGLKAAWMGLDPGGLNADKARVLLRDDAYLALFFMADDDDCSVDPDFASPSYTCSGDEDCLDGTGECKIDTFSSQLYGHEIKLCHGLIKKDYYSLCALMGDYKGPTHHQCAYDKNCKDCESDSDCDYGWECSAKGKCGPAIYSLSNIASYQAPPGSPVYSLSPVAKYHQLYQSLKKDPSMVFVATMVGDGLVFPEDKDSLISEECLQREDLLKCQAYATQKENAPDDCINAPDNDGCEEFRLAKLDCIRECYTASMGDSTNQSQAKNTYICQNNSNRSEHGSRYISLAEMFGPNGIALNLCHSENMEQVMKDYILHLEQHLIRACLPRPIEENEDIIMTITDENGKITTLEPGTLPDGDYRIQSPAPDCESQTIVVFNHRVDGAIAVTYVVK